MSRRLPLVRRPAAIRDMVDAVLWLREEASPRIAEDFVDAIEEALGLIVLHPLMGSGEVGIRLGIAGLRHFPVSGTPCVLYYVATEQRVDLVRVLHGRRDVDAELLGAASRPSRTRS